MSETLVIRDVDDTVVERLRALATVKSRTVEQQALEILVQALPAASKFDRVASSAAIRAMTPKGIQQTDSLELLREDRARDDFGE